MTVKDFAEKVLKYIYENRKNYLSSEKIGKHFKKTIKEINEALDYLKYKNLIDSWRHMLSGNNINIKLTSKGIDSIEKKKKINTIKKQQNKKSKNLNDLIQTIGVIIILIELFIGAGMRIISHFLPNYGWLGDIFFIVSLLILGIIYIIIKLKNKMKKNKKGALNWNLVWVVVLILFILWALCKLKIFCILK